jgi:hypothetical protein
MNIFINNSFDAKYPELQKMIIHKKLNPPKVSYECWFRCNIIILHIEWDLSRQFKMRERFTYNYINNEIGEFIKYGKIMVKKVKKTKSQIDLEQNLSTHSKDCNDIIESLKQENDQSKRKKIVFEHLDKFQDLYKMALKM